MDTPPATVPLGPHAARIHRLGRVLVVSCTVSFALAAALLLVGAVALLGAPGYQDARLTQTAVVVAFLLFALTGVTFAVWGLVQALYPALFIPAVRPVRSAFTGKWIMVRAPGSTATSVRPVFNVRRRQRLWGLYAIPVGVGVSIDALVLATTFNQDNGPLLPFGILFLLVVLFAIPSVVDGQRWEQVLEPSPQQPDVR